MIIFRLQQADKHTISPHYSTAFGETVKGTHVEMGRYTYEKGTGATPHHHPQEQVICVLSGKMLATLDGEQIEAGPGEAILIPPNTEHAVFAAEETQIISFKDIVPDWQAPVPPSPERKHSIPRQE